MARYESRKDALTHARLLEGIHGKEHVQVIGEDQFADDKFVRTWWRVYLLGVEPLCKKKESDDALR